MVRPVAARLLPGGCDYELTAQIDERSAKYDHRSDKKEKYSHSNGCN